MKLPNRGSETEMYTFSMFPHPFIVNFNQLFLFFSFRQPFANMQALFILIDYGPSAAYQLSILIP